MTKAQNLESKRPDEVGTKHPHQQQQQTTHTNELAVACGPQQRLSKSKDDLSQDANVKQTTSHVAYEISLELMKSEIRLICFLDLVHNLFLIFCLQYFLVMVGKKLHELTKFGQEATPVNGFQIPRASFWGVICGTLILTLVLIAGMWLIIRLRRATYPRDRYSGNISTPARHHFILNVILVAVGFICNFSFFIYYPYPDQREGALLLISNCFRAVSVCVLNRHVDQLVQSGEKSSFPPVASSVQTIILHSSQSTAVV